MRLYGAAAKLVDYLDRAASTTVLRWGCPVPYFGRLSTARVATVGINPSNREFVDEQGNELVDSQRRLPTLGSLGLESWSQADALDLAAILDACDHYFLARPYERWFKVLENVLGGLGFSYYGRRPTACHLDIVPFATTVKWGTIDPVERQLLLETTKSTMGSFLRASDIQLLILNGQSVVRHFADVAQVDFASSTVGEWSLPRAGSNHVPGIAYAGFISSLGEVDIQRTVMVLGYNHNLQSSFGVSAILMDAIRDWLQDRWEGFES